MRGLKRVIASKVFDLLLFVAATGLFNWPLLTITDRESVQSLYIYMFVCWGGIIVLLLSWAVYGRFSGENGEGRD